MKNNGANNNQVVKKSSVPTQKSLEAGLALLLQAHACAEDLGTDGWDFALEINELYEAGLTINELRWLVAKRLVRHGRETTVDGDPHRSVQPSSGFNFTAETCLLLTPAGVTFANSADCGSALTATSEIAISPIDPPATDESIDPRPDTKPRWNPMRRELWLGNTLVKSFRVPAANQETILSVFEEEGWPPHIDDPLPAVINVDPRARLHDAIYRLNCRQMNELLRFRGNGNANGILWEPLNMDSFSQHRPKTARQRTRQ